jgi:hypothetical protein
MTKTFRSSTREYQKSPPGAPDGVTSNPLARVTGSNGAFSVATEQARTQLVDTTFGAFAAATHEGRLITLRNTPPAASAVNSGQQLAENWTFRILQVVDVNTIVLEGFRTDVAGTGIQWTIHASCDLTCASADFPQDTGPTGTDGDGEDRSNSGPAEWQAVAFPTATDARLRFYPFWVTRRTSSTVLRISDPFDNLVTFPAEASLQWHLRDRPAYTYEQLFKIIHQFLLHCGWELWQFRGKNNGVGAGGDFNDNVYCVHDIIYRSLGEDDGTVMFLRFAMFHRNSNGDGTDNQGNWGFDMAMYSAWDRAFASVSVPGAVGSTLANLGNGINALSSHISTLTTNRWAAQADVVNTGNNGEPYFAPDNGLAGSAFGTYVAQSSPYDALAANRLFRPNNLGTPEGGGLADINYCFFGSRDEFHIWLSVRGWGQSFLSGGRLQVRADANGNNFATNFSAANGSNVLLRIGGPGTANGTNPTTTTPPYQIGDRIQTVGQTVNSPIVPGTSHAGEFIDSSVITDLPGLVGAIGILICPAGSAIADGNTFILNDGTNPAVTFEFDSDASVVETSTLRAVTFSGASTADQIRDAIVTAVTGAPALNISASGTISARVDLTNSTAGGSGNIPIVDTNNIFLTGTEGMDGGGYAIEIATLNNPIAAGALVGEDPQPMFFFRPNAVATVFSTTGGTQGVYRVSNRSNFQNATYRDHNGPNGTPPNANGFNALADLAGLSGTDTRDINPNERSGRFGAVAILCRDSDGGQLRGSMRYCRAANPRVGTHKLIRDRNADWHMLLPLRDAVDPDGQEITDEEIVLAIGPMPNAMVII